MSILKIEKFEYVIWVLTHWWWQQLAKSSLKWLPKLKAPWRQINSTAWVAVDCLSLLLPMFVCLTTTKLIHLFACLCQLVREAEKAKWLINYLLLIIIDINTWQLILFVLFLTCIVNHLAPKQTYYICLLLCVSASAWVHSHVISSLWVNLRARREREREKKKKKEYKEAEMRANGLAPWSLC